MGVYTPDGTGGSLGLGNSLFFVPFGEFSLPDKGFYLEALVK